MSELTFDNRHGQRAVWIFAVDLPDCDVPPLDALGVPVDPAHATLIHTRDIAEYGIVNYLTEANDLDPAQVEADRAKLESLNGPLLLVYANALPETGSFAPRAPLVFIGHYTGARAAHDPTPIKSRAAEGDMLGPQKKAPSDAAMSGRIAMIALIVMALLVGAMVFIGG